MPAFEMGTCTRCGSAETRLYHAEYENNAFGSPGLCGACWVNLGYEAPPADPPPAPPVRARTRATPPLVGPPPGSFGAHIPGPREAGSTTDQPDSERDTRSRIVTREGTQFFETKPVEPAGVFVDRVRQPDVSRDQPDREPLSSREGSISAPPGSPFTDES